MNLKKKFLIFNLFLILTLQILLFTNNNNQKTSFRYFRWTVQEVSIGKLISISFFSGLIISSLLSITIASYKKNSFEKLEENYESLNNDEDIKPNIEVPPERDIRDAQPTISVNYRVVKNNERSNYKNDQNFSNNSDNGDDWDKYENDW